MTRPDGIRIMLTVLIVLGLAAFGFWNWAWLLLGVGFFTEFSVMGMQAVGKMGKTATWRQV